MTARWLVPAAALAVLLCGVVTSSSVAAENDAQKLVETVGKSVVTIKTENGKTGSGFILDKTTVVTNFHVVAGAEKAEVVFHDKKRVAISGFWEVSRECANALTQVRVALSKAYGIEFPSFYQTSEEGKNSGGGKESEPAKELKRARSLIEAGKHDEAKSILRSLQEKHPSAPEAKEAGLLLKSL